MNSKQIYGILIDVVGLKIKIIIIERSGKDIKAILGDRIIFAFNRIRLLSDSIL